MTCIGIDLGTTNSEVAILRDGIPVVLSVDGSPLVPSAVSRAADGRLLVGRSALNNALAASGDTVRWIKREMGREVTVTIGRETYTPPMISALILKHLKSAAESVLGEPVTQAVITVPAFFTEPARLATREAATLAGLEVLRLVNEPSAAALAYAMGKRRQERWLVYDLGGGTFDVSVIDCSGEVMEVLASHGDTRLGGHDFDERLARLAADDLRRREGVDASADPVAWARLVDAAEQAKIRLSTEATTTIRLEHLLKHQGRDLHLEFPLDRPTLEQLLRSDLERTMLSVRTALKQARLTAADLSRVLLVGGATRMPLVSQLIEAELGIAPQAWIDPDTVVARGAAIEAAVLTGTQVGVVMADITPHSLGVEVMSFHGMENQILIRRNTPLPAVASRVFYKQAPDQDRLEIRVYQGESPNPEPNRLLGEFAMDHLGESERREVVCRLDLDRSGLLTMTVTDIASGKAHSQAMRQEAASRVAKAGLADLETVRLAAVEARFDDQDLDGEEPEEADADDVEDDGATEPETAAIDPALLVRTKAVLARTDLDPTDRSELERELEQAVQGNELAGQRLSELLYFLEA